MKNLLISNNMNEVPKAVDYVRAELKRRGISRKEVARTAFVVEDVLAKMVQTATDKISVTVDGFWGRASVKMSAKGNEFDLSDIEDNLLFSEGNSDNAEMNAFIHRLIEKVFADSMSIKNEYGVNKVVIRAKPSQIRSLLVTIFALLAGGGLGLFMQYFLPASVSKTVSANLFVPVYTMFMNALKMVVAPLVFFSVASALADFSDLKALGRMAIKVVCLYLLTSMIAIGVGYVTYQIFPIGDPSLVEAVTDAASSTIAKGQSAKISVIDTIVNIIPNNIITPFQKSDMLQLIFMAIVLGLASASLSSKFPALRNALALANALFSKITSVIVTLIPFIVFCSMAKMMLSMKLEKFMNVIVWLPTIYAGCFLMIVVYLLHLLIFARVNPLKFLGKFYPAMFSAYTLAASNPALPSSIKQCDEMGVSKNVYSFSLPLGATINMDGSCISLMITSLFMAKILGIPITGSIITTIVIAIMVLSVGSPGVPGGNLVCMTLLLPQIGVPAEAVSLVMGLYPIMAMMQTCANVTGDAVVTTIVAKQENLLDMKKYNS